MSPTPKTPDDLPDVELYEIEIDKEIRGREKPSDHVPIWIELNA